MKNKNDKRGKSPANFYDRIAEMLGKAAIPQTITVEAEGVSPETFSAAGITKRELEERPARGGSTGTNTKTAS